jgi:hypothetical protein
MKKQAKGPKFRILWIGIVNGALEFYRSDYYSGVLHADLFRTRKAAKKCYEEVRRIEVRETSPARGRKS